MGTSLATISLREAVRGFARHKSIFLVAVLTLALGLSLCTAMFCVLYGVVLKPFSYADRLVVAWAGYEGSANERDHFTEQALEEWRQASHAFDGVAGFRYTQLTLLQRGEPMDFQGAIVSPDLFSVLGAKAYLGQVFNPELAQAEKGKVVLLSHWLWQQRLGGDPAIVGKGVNLDGEIYTVTGVMPRDFDVPSHDVGFWVPLVTNPVKKLRNLIVIARLKPGVSLIQGQGDADAIARRLAAESPDANRGMRIHLIPFFDELIKDSRPFVLVGAAAALLVLLICCANLSNLLLVRAIERRSEFATRLAVGAQRRHLLGTVFAESLLLAVCGGIVGGVLARWMIEALVRLTPFELPRGGDLGHGLQIPLIAAALMVIAALLVSALPAWEVAKVRQQGAEVSRGSRSTSRRFARQLIATFEIAVALTLLAGSGLMARTMLALRDANPGWKTDHLIAAQIYLPKRRYHEPHEVQRVFETFIERLRNTPGVASVAASSALPTGKTGIDFDLPIQLPGKTNDNSGRASIRAVTPGYFKTMGIPLLQGRAFDDKDRGLELRRIMVNRAFVARYMPDSPSVVGKQVAIFLGPPANYEIVGVVGNVYHYGMLREPQPEFYVPFAAMPFGGMGVVVRTVGDPRTFAPEFRRQLWAVDPELPVSTLETMDNMVKDTWSDRNFLAALMVAFAVMAVALTALGVFSVVSFSVTRQVREIGIRMAMGARRDDVVRLMMGQSTRAAVAGLAGGLLGAWLLGRGLASLIYGVSPTDPWVLLGGVVCVAVIAGLGAYLPSRRAAKIDPMAALRME